VKLIVFLGSFLLKSLKSVIAQLAIHQTVYEQISNNHSRSVIDQWEVLVSKWEEDGSTADPFVEPETCERKNLQRLTAGLYYMQRIHWRRFGKLSQLKRLKKPNMVNYLRIPLQRPHSFVRAFN
jgi:hypothetical protein